MNSDGFIRALGAIVLGGGVGLVAYLLFDALVGGELAKLGGVFVAIVSALSFGWALS